MSFAYTRSFSLPFPVLPVVLHVFEGQSSNELPALIDTGADATLVPFSLLRRLRAEDSHTARVRSHWGEWRVATIYVIDVEVAGEILPAVDVIADEQGDTILLGRNVLNRLILLLDGPGKQTDVLSRRPVRL
jgi:predicted aspartyl protease